MRPEGIIEGEFDGTPNFIIIVAVICVVVIRKTQVRNP